MSKQLTDFLIELSKDPLLADRFKNDRVHEIARANFRGAEAELLKVDDLATLRSHFPHLLSRPEEAAGEAPKPPKHKPPKKKKTVKPRPPKKPGKKRRAGTKKK